MRLPDPELNMVNELSDFTNLTSEIRETSLALSVMKTELPEVKLILAGVFVRITTL